MDGFLKTLSTLSCLWLPWAQQLQEASPRAPASAVQAEEAESQTKWSQAGALQWQPFTSTDIFRSNHCFTEYLK